MNRASELDREEVGRRLGHDLYRFRRGSIHHDLPASVLEGVAAARSRRVDQLIADRFVGKWLQLRVNAYSRDRIVDERVTPELLRRIDVAECPVTRTSLTHAALLPTDWSVDRLNNNGAYAPCNLAVMSTQANRAKGSRSFDDVLALSRLHSVTDGLQPGEWLRLASLMLGPCFVEHAGRAPIIPLVTPLPSGTARPAVQIIQFVFTRFGGSCSGMNALIRSFKGANRHDASRIRLERFVALAHAALKRTNPCWDIWLRPEIMQAFVAWRGTLDLRNWVVAGEIARDVLRGHRVEDEAVQAWHLERCGYFH